MAVPSDAGPDRVAVGADGIAEVGPVRIGIALPRLQLRVEEVFAKGGQHRAICAALVRIAERCERSR